MHTTIVKVKVGADHLTTCPVCGQANNHVATAGNCKHLVKVTAKGVAHYRDPAASTFNRLADAMPKPLVFSEDTHRKLTDLRSDAELALMDYEDGNDGALIKTRSEYLKVKAYVIRCELAIMKYEGWCHAWWRSVSTAATAIFMIAATSVLAAGPEWSVVPAPDGPGNLNCDTSWWTSSATWNPAPNNAVADPIVTTNSQGLCSIRLVCPAPFSGQERSSAAVKCKSGRGLRHTLTLWVRGVVRAPDVFQVWVDGQAFTVPVNSPNAFTEVRLDCCTYNRAFMVQVCLARNQGGGCSGMWVDAISISSDDAVLARDGGPVEQE